MPLDVRPHDERCLTTSLEIIIISSTPLLSLTYAHHLQIYLDFLLLRTKSAMKILTLATSTKLEQELSKKMMIAERPGEEARKR